MAGKRKRKTSELTESKSKTHETTKQHTSQNQTICCACKKTEPPEQIKRFTKKPWIQCDICNLWWHLECSFLRIEDLQKIDKHKILFPCALCIFENSPWLELKENTEIQSTPKTTISISTQTEKIPEPDIIRITDIESPKTTNKKKINSSKKPQTKAEESEQIIQIKDKIVIIDGISRASDFMDSSNIKKEIKKHKQVNVKLAYPLTRGGISVHVENEEDRQKLITDWPEGAFNTDKSQLKAHNIEPKPICVFKNVPTTAIEEDIALQVEKLTSVQAKYRRLRYRDTNKALPVVIVYCNSQTDLQKLFQTKISISNKEIQIQAYRTKKNIPTRCFNCQQYGHISRNCTNNTICEQCAESHEGRCNIKKKKCANCSENHPASHKECPVYLSWRQKLINRH